MPVRCGDETRRWWLSDSLNFSHEQGLSKVSTGSDVYSILDELSGIAEVDFVFLPPKYLIFPKYSKDPDIGVRFPV
jgi:hypothetical protein